MENKFIITDICSVIMVGEGEYPEKHTVFSSHLARNELIFHFSGQTSVYFDNLILKTEPNTVRFLPKGEWARYEVVREEKGECIVVFFAADRPIAPAAFVKSVAQNEKVGFLFKKLFAVWSGKEEGYYFEAFSLLYHIFAELQKKDARAPLHAQKIAPALKKIHASSPEAELPVGELAAACGISESYFLRLFKEIYGVPPKKYIIQLKINRATELLRLARYSITQIAEMCGFSDVYFFSRQFKAYVGITPGAFVKKYRSSK